jgi:hypothetical protein
MRLLAFALALAITLFFLAPPGLAAHDRHQDDPGVGPPLHFLVCTGLGELDRRSVRVS